jgi:hypothetical protein
MAKKRKSQIEVQRDYDNRRKKEGLTRVTVWVPEHLKSALVSLALDMRNNNKEKDQL